MYFVKHDSLSSDCRYIADLDTEAKAYSRSESGIVRSELNTFRAADCS